MFAKAHPNIPRAIAYEMRNALAHGYFTIDHGIVWQTIQSNLPELDRSIKAALDALYPR